MQRWLMCAAVGLFTAIGAYFIASRQEASTFSLEDDVPPAQRAAVSRPPAPTAPIVLTKVVEMANLDPLLDPVPKADIGESFDGDPAWLAHD